MPDETLADKHEGLDEWQEIALTLGIAIGVMGAPSPAAFLGGGTFITAAALIRDPAIFSDAAEGWRDLRESLVGEDGVKSRISKKLEDVGLTWEGEATEAFLSYMNGTFLSNVDVLGSTAMGAASACDGAYSAIFTLNTGVLILAAGTLVSLFAASASPDGGAISKTAIITSSVGIALTLLAALLGQLAALAGQATGLEDTIVSGSDLLSADDSTVDDATQINPKKLEVMSEFDNWKPTDTD